MVKALIHYFLLLALLAPKNQLNAQTSEQKALEAKRAQIQKEIQEMNLLLSKEKAERGSVLEQMEVLDRKMNMRHELIRVTNRQSNLLNRQISANVLKVSKLREDLGLLKEDYAKLIVNAYQKRSNQNRLLFLLSSDGFLQAYKRLQYLKQYAGFRRQQGEGIKAMTAELTTLNKDMVGQRKIKEALLAENKKIKNQLSKEVESHKGLLKTIKANESKYAQAIKAKRQEAKRIDQEIEKLIRNAIAGSNKRAGTSGTPTFSLTPEAKALASSFAANKGKLIWPVEKGMKSQGFGVYADKIYPGIKHQNNGVTIATNKGQKARAIFDGEVIDVKTTLTGQKAIFIRHGNYISTYYNLANAYVSPGDKVTAREELGQVYTNKANGLTKLKFYLYQNTTKLNPEEWVYRL